MRKLVLIIAMILCCFAWSAAQEKSDLKPKIYLTRIDVYRNQYPLKGVLYEVKDSAVLFTPERSRENLSAGRFMVTRVDYSDIIKLKARKINSIKTGAIIGSVIGFFSVLFALPEDVTGIPAGVSAVLFGIPAAAIYGTAGSLIGSIGVKIRVNGSYENFSENRSKLQNYAYLKIHSYGSVDHSSFIGITEGPSFPLGDFGSRSSTSGHAGFARTGYMANVINIGYRIKDKFGVSLKGFDSQYDIDNGGPGEWWGFAGLMAGPMYSMQVIRVLSVDLTTGIGFATTNLAIRDDYQTGSTGFVADLNIMLRYNFANRWSLLSETGFFHNNPANDISGVKKIETYHLGIGIGYRFH